MGTLKDSEITQAKIIEAAGRLFAEFGFKGVTVRDIAAKADTHLSALNYHFKTKEALYREVVLEACKSASITPGEQEYLEGLSPKKALSVLVEEGLKAYGRQGASSWQNVIINRECWEPGRMFDEVAKEYFVPETAFMAKIIGAAAGRPADSPEVQFAVVTLVGLLETFGLYGHLIEAVAPDLARAGKKKSFYVKRITRQTLEAAHFSDGKKS